MEPPEGEPLGSRRRGRLAPLLVLATAVTVYLNTLALGFTWDDSWLILKNPRIDKPGYLHYLFIEQPLWRPLKRTTLMIDYQVWGREQPAGFHATNIAFHALASLALFALARRLAGPTAGLVAGLLFAAHPVHVEAVANITHRKEPMSLLFLVLAVLCYAAGRHPERSWSPLAAVLGRAGLARGASVEALRRAELWMLAWLSFLASMLSKEVGGVMFPVLIVAWEGAVERGTWRERLRPLLLFLAPSALVLVLYVFRGDLYLIPSRFTAHKVQDITGDPTATLARLPLVVLKAFGEYAGVVLWPSPLYLDRSFTVPRRAFEPEVLCSALAAVLYLALLVRVRRQPAVCFGLLWYIVTLVPIINVVPLTIWLVAERFLYVPSAGLALAAGAALGRWMEEEPGPSGRSRWARGRPAVVGLGVALLVCVWGALAMRQNLVWRDERSLWQHTLEYNPRSLRALYAVGLAHKNEGRIEEAEAYLYRAIAVNRNYAQAHYALAIMYLGLGRDSEAVHEAGKVTRIQPENPDGFSLLGNVELRRGCAEEAFLAYERAAQLEPDRPSLHYNLALAALRAGRDVEALAAADTAYALEPSLATVLLVVNALERLGRTEEALAILREQVDASRGAPEAVNQAMLLLEGEGLPGVAEAEVKRALRVRPGRPELHDYLELLACEREEGAVDPGTLSR